MVKTGGAVLALAASLLVPLEGAAAQPAAPTPPRAASPTPVPDQLSLAKLVWSTMAAVDHANKTGNYSVLRDLGSQAFQTNNNPAALGGTFAAMRQQQADLGDTLAVMPTFEIAEMVNPNVLRLRGSFATRPRPIQFDLLYAWNNGWRLEAIAIRAEP